MKRWSVLWIALFLMVACRHIPVAESDSQPMEAQSVEKATVADVPIADSSVQPEVQPKAEPSIADANDPILATFSGGEVRQSDFEAYLAYKSSVNAGGDLTTPLNGVANNPGFQRHYVLTIAYNRIAGKIIEQYDLDPQGSFEQEIQNTSYFQVWNQYMLRTMYPEKVKAGRMAYEKKAREYYDSHPDEFVKKPGEVRLRMIYFDTRGTSETVFREKMETAKSVRSRLLETPDAFAELAREYSEVPEDQRDKIMGPHDPEKLHSKIGEELLKLKPGEISSVIERAMGLYILQLVDQGDPEYKTYEESAAYLRAKTGGFYTFKIVNEYKKDLIGDEKPVYFIDEISSDTAALDRVIGRLGTVEITNRDFRYDLVFLDDARTNDPRDAEREISPVLEKKAIVEALKSRGFLESVEIQRILQLHGESRKSEFLNDRCIAGKLPSPLDSWGCGQAFAERALQEYGSQFVQLPEVPESLGFDVKYERGE